MLTHIHTYVMGVLDEAEPPDPREACVFRVREVGRGPGETRPELSLCPWAGVDAVRGGWQEVAV